MTHGARKSVGYRLQFNVVDIMAKVLSAPEVPSTPLNPMSTWKTGVFTSILTPSCCTSCQHTDIKVPTEIVKGTYCPVDVRE